MRGERTARDVAAPHPHVFGDVAQDVNQLQGLAESHTLLEKHRLGLGVRIIQVVEGHSGPELPYTAGYPVCVVVQFTIVFQSDNLPL